MSPKITLEEVQKAQREILALIQSDIKPLEAIKNAVGSLIERWQMLLQFIISLQLQVITQFGFSKDQMGLSSFNQQLITYQLNDETLRNLNKAKWNTLFKVAFDIQEEISPISLKEAQNIITDIANALQSEDFLKHVDDTMSSLQTSDIFSKRKHLLTLLLPLHLKIIEKHGFKGESGYLQVQKGLVEYHHDPIIAKVAQVTQNIVFERAKLLQ